MGYIGQTLTAVPLDADDLSDDIITLAKMASGTDGNIITYDASGNPAAVATGNDGQVLTSAGAGSPPAFETLTTGKVLQVVGNNVTAMSTGTTITPGDDTIPAITEGNPILSQALTASSTDNIVVVQALVTWEGSLNQNKIIAFHNTDYHATNAFACSNSHAADAGVMKQHSLMWIGNAFTTSASTYTVRCGMSAAGTMTFNGVSGSRILGGSAVCSIIITEISA